VDGGDAEARQPFEYRAIRTADIGVHDTHGSYLWRR
jgi:hypothetical protein